jgi:hypothetical protein
MASAIVRRNITNNLKRLPSLSCWVFNNNNHNHLLKNVEHGGSGTVSFHAEAAGVGLPSYMRGAVYWEPNKPLTIEEFHIPRPKAGELLIKTKGMCILYTYLFLDSTIYFYSILTYK